MSGSSVTDHFPEVRKMIKTGKGAAKREEANMTLPAQKEEKQVASPQLRDHILTV
jgi:hypothetical protein